MSSNKGWAISGPTPSDSQEQTMQHMEPWLWTSPTELPDTSPHRSELIYVTEPLSPFQIPDLSNPCPWPGCKSVQKVFLTSQDLDFHIQTYHMQQCPWPACNTGKVFRRRSDLTRHMESVHSGVRRFMCDFPCCPKAYARNDKLIAHKRSHGTVPPLLPISNNNNNFYTIAHHHKTLSPSLGQAHYPAKQIGQLHEPQNEPVLAPAGRKCFEATACSAFSSLPFLRDQIPMLDRAEVDNVLAPAGQIKSSVADFHHEYLGLRSGWKGCHSTMFPNVRQASFQENQSFSSNPDGNSYIAFPNPTDCVLEASSKSVSKSNSEGESDIDHENGATRL